MAKVGFIGLGNMGGPMVRNLIKAGHSLKVYDLSEDAINFAVQAGAMATKSVKEASSDADQITSIITNAPDGFRVWSGNDNETFSYLLEKKINRPVYNLAVSGYGTVRELIRLRESNLLEKMCLIIFFNFS